MYGNNVDHIIFITNGERDVLGFPDTIEYIKQRRKESYNWIKNNCPNCDIVYLNFPDDKGPEEFISGWAAEIYEKINGESVVEFAKKRISKLIGSNTILVPNADSHPSHKLSNILCEVFSNKKIHYILQEVINKSITKPPGVYYKRTSGIVNYYTYYYVYSKEATRNKNKEFKAFYPSQESSFSKSDMKIKNWEGYISEIPLVLCSEDLVQEIQMKE